MHEVHGSRQRVSNDALYFGFANRRSGFESETGTEEERYPLTWPEKSLAHSVFLGSFLAVRAVYALVPFLMALGCVPLQRFSL